MRISPNKSSLRRRCEVRLTTRAALTQFHGLWAVKFRGDDEAGHHGAEAHAPHCSRPSWSFLIIEEAQSAPSQLSQIYWCKVWQQTPLLARVIGGKTFDLASGRHVERA